MPPKFKRNADYSGAQEAERTALLDDHSEDEDFFLRGPSAQTGRLADNKVTRLQGQVDEVVEVMQDNIGKVMDRGDRLDDLQDKSDNLVSSADRFRVQARGLRHQMWWRECKMRILLGVVIFVILLIIIIPVIIRHTKK